MEICPEIAPFHLKSKTRQKTHRDPWEFTNTVFTAPVLLLQLYQATAVFTTTIFYYYEFTTMNFTKLTTIKIHMRRAAGRGYSYFHLYMCSMCVFIYVCHASWPNETLYRPEIWNTQFPIPYLKTFFFRKKVTLKAASLEKLPCHVDFPHISSLPCLILILFFLNSG